jgi:hypothetical protein
MRNIAARHPHLFRAAISPVLTASALLALIPLGVRADEITPAKQHEIDSFSFSARVGFNISARFRNPGKISFGNSTRTTPDGLTYNYEDGYVFADSSGEGSGSTWNWGYDNSATQVSGNNVLLNKTVSVGDISSPWINMDPAVGGELTYRHEFGEFPQLRDLRWGFEAAGSLVNIRANDHRTYGGKATRQTDAYAFESGATPPDATPDSPYQGTFNGPGFIIGDTPVSSTLSSSPATISGNRRLDTDLWGFRLGPYAEIPLGTNFNLSLSGGFAGALLDVGTSWNETLSVGMSQYPFSGSGRDHEWRMGYYIAGNAEWMFANDWSLNGGVQFQSLSDYSHAISGRTIEIDLSKSIFVTLGLAYHF